MDTPEAQPERTTDFETLGQMLTRLREAAELSIADLAEITKIQKKYIAALEGDMHADLPDPLYIKHFLRAIAGVLRTPPEVILHKYQPPEEAPQLLPPQPPSRLAFIVPSRVISQIGIVAVVLVVAIVLLVQLRAISAPPALSVEAPSESAALSDPVTTVSGRTERTATVTINGERVIPESDGRFTVDIDLHEGVNVIKIAAKKTHSGERIIYRQVVVETPQPATTTPR